MNESWLRLLWRQLIWSFLIGLFALLAFEPEVGAPIAAAVCILQGLSLTPLQLLVRWERVRAIDSADRQEAYRIQAEARRYRATATMCIVALFLVVVARVSA